MTRYQALPGNADPEALPPILSSEAEPLDIGSQTLPRNQLRCVAARLSIFLGIIGGDAPYDVGLMTNN
ncbi:MAG: hypothetical protein HC789_07120 [Microcoleus sp. CSU_2_2]|nr:hypothetical protein [Microcoleus sp. SU_5_3]NJS10160.1 hypothetical protein [Microcoleus sp. CSU_2_2]